MRITLLLFLFSTLSVFTVLAQQEKEFCGTQHFESPSLEIWRQHRPDVQLRSVDDTIYLKVKVHIVGNDDGEGYYSMTNLYNSFCKLNKDMEPTGIQLELNTDINYINSSSYYEHSGALGRLMMGQYNVNNHVNCYIVADPNGNCGYYSGQQDAIALSKGCLGRNSTTWSHELGHYLSLPHTFSGWEGTIYEYGEVAPERVGNNNVLVEKLDGSNCQTSGDKFCDTKADYLSFRWLCSGSVSPDSLIDPDSASFVVDGTNIMSYSNDACASVFSDEQIDAMRFNIQMGRLNEVSQSSLPQPVDFDRNEFIVYSGKDLEELQYDNVTLSWQPMTNATHYYIELSEKSFFPGPPDYQIVVSDTFLNIALEEDTRYEWEIKGFNQRYTCAGFSDEYEFIATTLTSAQNPELQSAYEVFPNPLGSGQPLYIKLTDQSIDKSNIKIYSLDGKLLYERNFTSSVQGSMIEMNNLTMGAGVYYLQYSDERGFATRKLIIY